MREPRNQECHDSEDRHSYRRKQRPDQNPRGEGVALLRSDRIGVIAHLRGVYWLNKYLRAKREDAENKIGPAENMRGGELGVYAQRDHAQNGDEAVTDQDERA